MPTDPTPEAYEAAFRAVDDADYNTAQIAVDAVWPIAEATVRAKVAAEIRTLCECATSDDRQVLRVRTRRPYR